MYFPEPIVVQDAQEPRSQAPPPKSHIIPRASLTEQGAEIMALSSEEETTQQYIDQCYQSQFFYCPPFDAIWQQNFDAVWQQNFDAIWQENFDAIWHQFGPGLAAKSPTTWPLCFFCTKR